MDLKPYWDRPAQVRAQAEVAEKIAAILGGEVTPRSAEDTTAHEVEVPIPGGTLTITVRASIPFPGGPYGEA